MSVSPRSGRNGARNERSGGLREAQLTREGPQAPAYAEARTESELTPAKRTLEERLDCRSTLRRHAFERTALSAHLAKAQQLHADH